jgi:hypothetical protein
MAESLAFLPMLLLESLFYFQNFSHSFDKILPMFVADL